MIRVLLAHRFEAGDLLVHKEWGERFWQVGARNFYTDKDWYFSRPTQPPLTSLMFAGAFYLFDHKYRLAELHNIAKIPPAFFIIYFYDYGYTLLLKLPAILADLGIGILVYKLVFDLSKSRKKGTLASVFYLFNPATVFLSGVWGQTESLIAFLGLLAFVLAFYGKIWISLPLLFASLYFKPTWSIMLPLYLFLLYLKKPKFSEILLGGILTAGVFLASTLPFAGKNVIQFTKTIAIHNIAPHAKGTAKASISAFNFHTIFMEIDRNLDADEIAGFPVKLLGLVSYSFVNLFSLAYLKRQKLSLTGLIAAMFAVGMGAILFLTNMLERYFFVGFVPLVILLFTEPKTILWSLSINVVFFANLFWAYFRRVSDEVDHPFTNYNFLLIRVLSFINVVSWVYILKSLKFVKRRG